VDRTNAECSFDKFDKQRDVATIKVLRLYKDTTRFWLILSAIANDMHNQTLRLCKSDSRKSGGYLRRERPVYILSTFAAAIADTDAASV
jgi:hypothetical protein